MTELTTTSDETLRSNKTLTWVIYGLYGASFLIGITWIVAIILNYVKRGDVAGTYLESHFTWQIRTFWFAMLWACLIFLVGAILAIVLVGFAVWIVGFIALGIWAIYRIARGWMALNARQPLP